MKRSNQGFTLIELMIVVAIIAILAAIAIPAYQSYAIPAKISEAVVNADPAKIAVAEGYATGGMTGVASAQSAIPASSTKYVRSITIDGTTGVITMEVRGTQYNGIPVGQDKHELTMSPSISGKTLPAAFAANVIGAIDWACASSTNVTAAKRNLPVTAPTTKLDSKYAPAECR